MQNSSGSSAHRFAWMNQSPARQTPDMHWNLALAALSILSSAESEDFLRPARFRRSPFGARSPYGAAACSKPASAALTTLQCPHCLDLPCPVMSPPANDIGMKTLSSLKLK